MSKPLKSAKGELRIFHNVDENGEIVVDRLQLTNSRKYTALLISAMIKVVCMESRNTLTFH
jgi:hypothetical protein